MTWSNMPLNRLLFHHRSNKSEDLVYLDESGIDKFLHRDYARSLRGEQVVFDQGYAVDSPSYYM